jgi:hypothetical protein
VNRQRTNTPLQALVLMNDPQYVEAARKVGERMVMDGGPTARERARYAFRLVTSRTPSEEELSLMERLYADERARFAKQPAAARGLLSTGKSPRHPALPVADVAAGTVVASTLLNADLTVMKR